MRTFLDEFLAYLEKQNRSAYTLIAYKKDLSQLIDFLNDQKVDDLSQVDHQHLTDFIQSLFKRGFAAKTVSRKINAMRTFFRFLIQEKRLFDKDPSIRINHPKIPAKSTRFLNKLEYRALRDVVRDNPRIYAIVELMLQTGIRIGEVSRLRLSDIKPRRLIIRPFESNNGRQIPLNKNAQKAVKAYLKVRPQSEDDHLFLTRTGSPLSVRNLRASIDRAFKKAGIHDARVSDIRHTFIAQQLLRGTPIVVISKIVGHKRSETTSRYLDFLKNYDSKQYIVHEL